MSRLANKSWDGFSLTKKLEMPEGVWTKCPGCEETIFTRSIEENLKVCPQCQHHFRVDARSRVEQLSDKDSFEELLANYTSGDPLEFSDLKKYKDRVVTYREKTGLNEAAVLGRAFIKGRPVMLVVLDFTFIGASMGSVVGEKITVGAEMAAEAQIPFIAVSCSGGARMQEGIISLCQMAKTSAAIAKLDDVGGLFISILTDPTTGGVTASYAMLGDIIIAEPNALIGFAGPRVIANTIKVELPQGFQRAEFLVEHGFIDFVVPRHELRNEIARIIDYCGK